MQQQKNTMQQTTQYNANTQLNQKHTVQQTIQKTQYKTNTMQTNTQYKHITTKH